METPDRWERLKDLIEEGLRLSGTNRVEFLERVCAQSPSLGFELKFFLAKEKEAGDFLEGVPTLYDERETDERIGCIVSHYRILAKLGQGGMGVVYEAEDLNLPRRVALKFLRDTVCKDQHALELFRREAFAASALNHPNICVIHDVGEHDSQPFIIMEMLQGETLQSRIDRNPLPTDELTRISTQLADALDAAHRQGIIHGDIKPGNLFICGNLHVKLLDFGLAKLTWATSNLDDAKRIASFSKLRSTMPVLPLGTLPYMSPEQILGNKVDQRSDIFSFGVVMYEMATGTRPFPEDTWMSLAHAIVNKTPASPLNPFLPPELIGTISKSLEKDPNLRYQTAADLKADLLHVRPDKPRETRIAVLPFVDLSARKDQEYFCDGIAEELINALGATKGLRVASRTSSFGFRHRDCDALEVGRRLKVDSILDGSVRKDSDRLRISVALTDTTNGYQLWSESYDRPMDDIFQIQDEIASAIVERFRVSHLGSSEMGRRSQTPNVAAYELYLKGRYNWNNRTETALRDSIDCYYHAIALDHSYAAAYAGLADSYLTLGLYGSSPPADTMILARSAAERALELNDSSVEAMTALACVRCVFEWNWAAGEQNFRRATRSASHYATAHQWYAVHCLAPLARFDEAHAELQRALELDPSSLATATSVGVLHYFERRYDEAINEQLRILQTEPGFGMAYYFLGQAYLEKRMFQQATDTLSHAVELMGRSSEALTMLGRALAESGNTSGAKMILHELHERSKQIYVSPVLLAILEISIGEFDEAFSYLNHALAMRATDLIWIAVRPHFDPVRSRPEFERLCNEVRLGRGSGEFRR